MKHVFRVTRPHVILWLSHLLTICYSQAFIPIDDLLKQSYQTETEYTQQSKNESQFLTEFHDRVERKGYIKRLAEGALTHEYYFQATDEYVKITDASCNVSKLSDQQNDYNFQEGGIQYAFASSVLKLLPAKAMEYKGSSKVRGISTSHYQGTKDGVTFDAYIREGRWRGADNDTAHIPVRVVVKNTTDNEVAFYDFHHFRRNIQRYSDMNLRIGFGCIGKKNPPNMVLPSIPSQVSFEYEIFDYGAGGEKSPAEQLELNTMWYDAAQKIARVDLTSWSGKTTTEIHDFNTGVMYVKDGRTCTINHVTSSKFSYTKEGRMISLMKTPDQLLGLSSDLYYVGKDMMRGAMCDIWESVEENAVLKGQKYARVVTTYYFTQLKWLSTLDGSDDAFIPLRKTVVAYENDDDMRLPDSSVAYNIFDYAEQSSYDPSFFKHFDISDCFAGPDSRTYFEISLKWDAHTSQTTMLKYRSLIRTITKEQIYTITEISPLRLPGVYLTVKEDNTVHVVVVLLAQPPALASFVLDEILATPGKNMRKAKYMPSQEDCAKECLPDTACMVFLYREHVCYFADSDDSERWGTQVSQDFFEKFIKADANVTTMYQSNADVIKKIKGEVESGNFLVSFQTPDTDDVYKITLTAFQFLADASPFGERIRDRPYTLVTKAQTLSLKPSTAMVAKPLGASGPISSIQQCYRTCTEENSISCASFSYCSATSECRLSSVMMDIDNLDSRESAVKDTRCNIYTRSYLNFFKKFPGSVVRVGGDVSVAGVTSAAGCAKECKHNKEIRCRGFEFCENSNFCVLHEAHFLDIESVDIVNGSDFCSHYAAKFIADYWEIGRKFVEDPMARVVQLVSVEDCAKQCSLDPSGLCKSFNYCPGDDGPDTKCFLNTVSVLDDGVQLKDTKGCYHYYQEDDVHDFITRGWYKAPQGAIRGVTSGSLGGLLFAMLLVGLIAGVGGLFAFTYWQARKRPDDGGTIRFVNHINE
ncbi:uncharacterized protein LOC135398893 [Ornithodoros turicata]|uniref:uncharacterized protein LOC135398893 n=1 Tax=Ornithodoros turicata TaxID=34597 RepID=UPI00313905F6